jgi:hypothetical protein
MPSVVGTFKIVTNTGQIEFGDTIVFSPNHFTKTYSGSGVAPTGDFSKTINFFSSTNTFDSDAADQTVKRFPFGPFSW